jgi:hypothetical protein
MLESDRQAGSDLCGKGEVFGIFGVVAAVM